MNKDTDGGLQPGRDPDDIDAAQAALNRMRDAAAARGEIRRKAPPRPGTSAQKPARSTGSTRGFGQFHGTGRDPLGLEGRGSPRRGTRLELTGRRRFRDGTVDRPGGPGNLGALHARELRGHHPARSLRFHGLGNAAAAAEHQPAGKFRTELGDGVVTKSRCWDPRPRAGARAPDGQRPRPPRHLRIAPGRPQCAPDLKQSLQKCLKNPRTARRALQRPGVV